MADKLTPAQRQQLIAEARGLQGGADYRDEWHSPMLQKDAKLSRPISGPGKVNKWFDAFLTGPAANSPTAETLYYVDPQTDHYHRGADYYNRSKALQAALTRVDSMGDFVQADPDLYAEHNMTKHQPFKATKQLDMLEFALPEGYYGSERHRREEAISQRMGEPLTEEVKIARRMKYLASLNAPPSNSHHATRVYEDERLRALDNVAPGSPTYQGADSAVNQMVRAGYDERRRALSPYPEGEPDIRRNQWNKGER